MSTKRIVAMSIAGAAVIVAALAFMLLASFLGRDSDAVRLPDTPVSSEGPRGTTPDALDLVEVTPDTVQAVVSALSRPVAYSRELVIENLWEGGSATFNISVSVSGGVTSLSALPPIGPVKRIVVTPDTLYIWYDGDRAPFTGDIRSTGEGHRTSDEWQMLVTYEDILVLDKNDIVDAGYTVFGGEDCIYAVYSSPLLGNTRTYYISTELGLVIAAKEYDAGGALIYTMASGECRVGEADPAAFTLPDGTSLIVY